MEADPVTRFDLWLLPVGGETGGAERKPQPFLRTGAAERHGRVSPDGRWVAYDSDETGRYEIFVRPFPGSSAGGEDRRQVSTGGGVEPRWCKDGRELFYIGPDRKLMAAEVTPGSRFRVGVPRPLFQTRITTRFVTGRYDVTADGRFVINSEPEEPGAAPATVIWNWPAARRN